MISIDSKSVIKGHCHCPSSITTWSLADSSSPKSLGPRGNLVIRGPKWCHGSFLKKNEFPCPVRNSVIGRMELRSRSSFRHPHDPPFSLIVQIEVSRNRPCFNQSTEIDVRLHLITSHSFYAIKARLRIPISLIPWPPSIFGLHSFGRRAISDDLNTRNEHLPP